MFVFFICECQFSNFADSCLKRHLGFPVLLHLMNNVSVFRVTFIYHLCFQNGVTPLHVACTKNNLKVVELLLKYGTPIDVTTEVWVCYTNRKIYLKIEHILSVLITIFTCFSMGTLSH
jgi:hypothetical protein